MPRNEVASSSPAVELPQFFAVVAPSPTSADPDGAQVQELADASLQSPAFDTRFWREFQEAALGVVLLDREGHVRAANPVLAELLGYQPDELGGVPLVDLAHPMDRKRGARVLQQLVAGEAGTAATETRLLHKTGSLLWASLSLHRMYGRDGEVEGVLGVVDDLSSGQEVADALHRLSTTDDLTGLFNRRGFHLLAELQWRIARRKQREMLLLYVDVDGLKQVNDRFGHTTGDELLRETAEILRGICRETDVVARVGGDEFVILAVEAVGESVGLFRERLSQSLAERNARPGRRYPISLSVGAAYFGPHQQHSVEELLLEADRRMYERKRGGEQDEQLVVAAAPTRHADPDPAAPLVAALREIVALAGSEAEQPHDRLTAIRQLALAALGGMSVSTLPEPGSGHAG